VLQTWFCNLLGVITCQVVLGNLVTCSGTGYIGPLLSLPLFLLYLSLLSRWYIDGSQASHLEYTRAVTLD
jgi:hypothetical protein